MAEVPSHQRHYEVVTPLDKLGQSTSVSGISPDGHIVQYTNIGGNGLPGSGSQDPVENTHLAVRDNARWGRFPMNPPWASLQAYARSAVDATPSLRTQLFLGYEDTADGRKHAFYTRRPGEDPVRASVEFQNRAGSNAVRHEFRGSSEDLRHTFFSVRAGVSADQEVAYLPTDPPPWPSGASAGKLYESVAADAPVLRRVDVNAAGEPINPPDACGGAADRQAELGSANQRERAVSSDGSRVFFTVAPDCGARRLFARIDAASTVELSASECDRVADPLAVPPVAACAPSSGDDVYASASADGHQVFFVSPNQLADADLDSAPDLYRFDFDAPVGQRLTLLSRGDASNPTPGVGADVRAVVRTSEDGRRVYFVAGGVLTTSTNGQGQAAVAGGNNLYLYDSASGIRFVGTLDPVSDWAMVWNVASRPAQLADSAGRYLVFASVAPLTSDDADSTQDIFRYDAATGSLLRISVARNGFGTNGNASASASISLLSYEIASRARELSRARNVSADGQRVVFATAEALEPGDVNEASDVYEWHDGAIGLISDGESPVGTADPNGNGTGRSFAISADGSAVAFSTAASLLPARDPDTIGDVYVARLGADVDDPLPPAPPAPCVGDACQGEAELHGLPGTVSTMTFFGSGNAVLGSASSPGRLVVSKRSSIAGPRGNLKVRTPGGGRLSAAGKGIKAVRRTVASGGTYSVKLVLTAKARRTLQRRGRMKVSVRVSFAPVAGKTSKLRLPVTFRSRTKKEERS